MTAEEFFKGSTIISTLNEDNFPLGMDKDLKDEMYKLAEQYANQRVIEELENLMKLEIEIEGVYKDYEAVSVYDIQDRIKELKQK